MSIYVKMICAASALALIAACNDSPPQQPESEREVQPMVAAENENQPMPVAENKEQAMTMAENEVQPMVMAAVEEAQGNSSNISIGIIEGAPTFVGERSVTCHEDGRCGESTGMALGGISGNIDLSKFPPGEVALSISIGDDAYDAGWRFPSNPYQAVALVIYPEDGPKPNPVFGNWPEGQEFGTPSVSEDFRTVSFVDHDDDNLAYEYAVAIEGPGGRVVLDPRIENGGVSNR